MEISTNTGRADIEGLPNKCPYCHKAIRPVPLYGFQPGYQNSLEVFMACPDSECKRGFIGYYYPRINDYSFTGITTKGNIIAKHFPKTISEVSKTFQVIYNQSYAAEQQELFEICGVGYRKSLEFLIKDYAISKYPDEQAQIEKKLLMQCIESYADDIRIKTVAKRAAWLGNDETHYVRKWEGRNLEDLKKLIELTVHWIEMEKLTESFENDMPEGKK